MKHENKALAQDCKNACFVSSEAIQLNWQFNWLFQCLGLELSGGEGRW